MFSKLGYRSYSKSTGRDVFNYYAKVLVWEDRFARQRFVLSIPFTLEYISVYLSIPFILRVYSNLLVSSTTTMFQFTRIFNNRSTLSFLPT